MCFEEKDKKRKVREAIKRIKHDTAINFESDAVTITNVYSPIIKNARQRTKV